MAKSNDGDKKDVKKRGGLFDRLGRTLRDGVDKGRQLGRLGLLKAELHTANSAVRETQAEFGAAVVLRLRDAEDEDEDAGIVLSTDDKDLAPILKQLATREKLVANLELKIERNKSGKTDGSDAGSDAD